MTSTILVAKGHIKRVVRSQRLFKGVQVGAIRDKGYLVMVRTMEPSEDCWVPIHVIRKIEK